MQTRDQGKIKTLDAAARAFAKRLRHEFAKDLARNPSGFRREAVRVFSASLSPGPGRPKLSNITLATEEREKGTAWKEIYLKCIPHFSDLCRDSQRVEAENLRAAVRSRRNARRRRNPTREFFTN